MGTRSFIALNLDPAVRDSLAKARESIGQPAGSRIRWTPSENLHVTVKFLGQVHDEALPDVCRVAEEAVASVEPFSFSVHGVMAIPPCGPRPRMLWAGIEGADGPLADLFGKLEDGLAGIGFGRDRRPFRPHVTLARIRHVADTGEILRLVRELEDIPFGQTEAEALTVFGSELSSRGATYTPLSTATLQG